jgi:hypothetical protein
VHHGFQLNCELLMNRRSKCKEFISEVIPGRGEEVMEKGSRYQDHQAIQSYQASYYHGQSQLHAARKLCKCKIKHTPLF